MYNFGTHLKVMTKMFKKCSIDQRFIRKSNTAYKIHTLGRQCFIIAYVFAMVLVDVSNDRNNQADDV